MIIHSNIILVQIITIILLQTLQKQDNNQIIEQNNIQNKQKTICYGYDLYYYDSDCELHCTNSCPNSYPVKSSKDKRQCVEYCGANQYIEIQESGFQCTKKCKYGLNSSYSIICNEKCPDYTVNILGSCADEGALYLSLEIIGIIVGNVLVFLPFIICCCKSRDLCCFASKYDKEEKKKAKKERKEAKQKIKEYKKYYIDPQQCKYFISKNSKIYKRIIRSYCKDFDIQVEQKYIYPSFQGNDDQMTIAMWLAKKDIEPPKIFEHDPIIQDRFGRTVAMIYASQGIDPPVQWRHDPNIVPGNGMPVGMRLAFKGIQVPDYWHHNPAIQDDDGYTTAMYITQFCKQIPDQSWYHAPEITNRDLYTVAMLIVGVCKKVPPAMWYHDSSIQDIDGDTVAMWMAKVGMVPPVQWQHDPRLQNRQGWTVGMLLANNLKIIPQQCWMHGNDLFNDRQENLQMIINRVQNQNNQNDTIVVVIRRRQQPNE